MNCPNETLAYLRYLRSRIDALMCTDRLGIQEIGPLQGELRLFRERVPSLRFASPELKEHLGSIHLGIAAVHLAGTKEHIRATWWMHLPWLGFFRTTREQRDREVIEANLSDLRTRLYDLYCLVEVTFPERNQPPEPTS